MGRGGVGWAVEVWDGPWRCGMGRGGVGWAVEVWDGPWRCGMGRGGVGWAVEVWDGLWRWQTVIYSLSSKEQGEAWHYRYGIYILVNYIYQLEYHAINTTQRG